MKKMILGTLIFVFLIGLFVNGAASATVIPPETPPARVRVVLADSSLKPIEIREVERKSEVVGSISNTVIEMAFLNPNSRVLEGELQFPLQNNQTISAFSLEMEDGKMRDAVPVDKNKGREIFEEIVRRSVDPALMEMTSGNNFKLRIYPLTPGKARRVKIVITEQLTNKSANKKLYTGQKDGKNYFYAEIPISENAIIKNINKIDIFWDASASGKKRGLAKELSFLEAFFAKISNVSVSLTVVRNAAEPPLKFDIRGGNWRELKSVLENMIYDGATNLGTLSDVGGGADMTMLFSDGLDNFSTKNLTKISDGKVPLFAFVSSAGADINRLRHLAEKSGGAFIDLTACEAQAALRYMNYRAENVSFNGGVSDTAWNISGNVLRVSGIINDKNAPLSVTVNNEKISLDSEPHNEYAFVPSIWAAIKISGLEAEYDLNKGEIRRLGKTFGIVTRGTSLIVLERAEDYVLYDIDPPAELKKEYDKLRVSGTPKRKSEQNKVERVVKEWQAREKWWNEKFDKDPVPERKKPVKQGIDEARYAGTSNTSFAAPSSAPAPESAAARDSVSQNKQESVGNESETVKISVRQWTSDAPYISRMKDASAEQIYRIYLDERPDYENSPAFYVDAAFQLEAKGQKELSLRVLSNLAEINLENRQTLRVLGHKLMQIGHPEFAAVIFKKVVEIGGEEPQSYRDLGLAYQAIGEYQKAVDALYTAVEKNFTRNFPGVEVIALTDMNKIIAVSPVKIDTRHIDPRLLKNMPLDLRVILVWDSDVTDIDLHVTDPNGEDASYAYPLTYQGGRMSPDNTTGYGPEEFSLRNAKPGKYTVKVHFYGHRQQAISEATTIQLDFFTKYGTKEQNKQSVTMRLKDRGENIFVGEFEVK